MKGRIAIQAMTILVLLSIGVIFASNNQNEPQSTPISQLIQPGWEYTYTRTRTNTNILHSYLETRNLTTNQFLGLIDIYDESMNVLAVDEHSTVTTVNTNSVDVSIDQTGSYGEASNSSATYISYYTDTNTNDTTTDATQYPLVMNSYASSFQYTLLVNTTYFPQPAAFMTLNPYLETYIVPKPVQWAYGNITILPLQIHVNTTQESLMINGNMRQFNITNVYITETQSTWFQESQYPSIYGYNISYTITAVLTVRTVLSYDQSTGMLLKFKYYVTLEFDYQSTYSAPTGYTTKQGSPFFYRESKLNQNLPNPDLTVIENYYYKFMTVDEGFLESITHLYQDTTTTDTTHDETTSTGETSTETTPNESSESSITTETSGTTTTQENTSLEPQSTDTNTTSLPGLPLPGFTLSQFITVSLIMSMSLIILRKQKHHS